jgi:tetratricopeptide (TPR) repeat protein
MAKHCKNCKAELPNDAKFCPKCGADTRQGELVRCPKCETQNPAAAKFCKKCGTSLSETKKKSADTHPLSRLQFWMLQAAGFLALMVVGIYYYYGIIKPVENRPVFGQAAQQQVSQAPTQHEEHNHPAPSAEEIQAAADQLKSNPENAVLNVQMGNKLFDSGRYSDAVPYYQKALSINSDDPDVTVDLGVCFFNMQEYSRAKEQFERALQLNPQHVNALYNSGVVSFQLGEKEQIIQYWSRLMEVAPNSPQAARAIQILNESHQNMQGDGTGGS